MFIISKKKGQGTTYWSILPIVTKIIVLALHRILYRTKVQNLVIFWLNIFKSCFNRILYVLNINIRIK